MSLQQSSLKVSVNNSPELLERVLRVARHRGFKVELLSWNSESSTLEMTVSSERKISLLSKQLEKLIDVTQVVNLTEITQEQRA
ncbi:MAG: acetolactate synthase 2 small subunit [Gammaproteobacteria bacterium]|nr:acetolactate synthase 2 small subunit [Gammaproteobacteria bacterium]